jgi:PncC family amidohydrolase
MKDLLPHAESVAVLLKQRKETIAVAESSAGGLIAAALLAVPGASAYFVGGTVLYTRTALTKLLNVAESDLQGLRPTSEPYALLKAKRLRAQLSTTWAIAENGVAGPAGNRYHEAPGRTAIALSGPLERVRMVETGSSDRLQNMYAFATAALEVLHAALEDKK